MKRSRIFFLFLLLSINTVFPPGALADQGDIAITVDPRVELMSLIFRLAGNTEYNIGLVPSYLADADQYFNDFRDHEAIKMATRLRLEAGVSYDAVAGLAVHVTDPPLLEERVSFDPVPDSLDKRWTTESAREFLLQARKFSVESHFMKFFDDHRELYRQTRNSMNMVLGNKDVVSWSQAYFGSRPEADFFVELALFNGGNCYGPHFSSPGKEDELHSILGVWNVDIKGQPFFTADIVETIVHEFGHSFINPLVNEWESSLEKSGQTLYPLVSEKMGRMAYETWKTMMNESLVRAVSIRYVNAKSGSAKAKAQVKHQQEIGFYWMSDLNDLLAGYEGARDRYPTFSSFRPEIEKFFTTYAADAEARIANVEKVWAAELEVKKIKAPSVVSMSPENNSQDVDPSVTEIVVTFDRAMMDRRWSVMKTGGNFPEIAGSVRYNDDRTRFIMPVALKPATSYEFSLNSANGGGFCDKDGNQLLQYFVRFKTAGE